ncbi:BlaI/MecI/CopY family transcriptional regulator [Clostridiaceae bacterium M8S5]|nr:BlaI/MecI/CopY family transcriptional regulator [Clostridiaceae bacterium M8S5]
MERLPDAELTIMLVIWNSNKPLTSNQILDKLQNKKWHVTTLNKLLSRLIKRGFIRVEVEGRPKKYGYIIDENDYKRWESKTFFSKLHKNSFKSLIASLCSDDKLTNDDIKEIEELIHLHKEDDE